MMGVWITCRSPAPSEIVLCKTKQMCPGLAPSEGTAPAAARSPAPGPSPRQHLQEQGRAVLQLTRALGELRARGAARLRRAPGATRQGPQHQLCTSSAQPQERPHPSRAGPVWLLGQGLGRARWAQPHVFSPGAIFPWALGGPPGPQPLPREPRAAPGRCFPLPAPLQGHAALQQEVSPRDPPPRSAHATAAAQQPAPNAGLATQSTPDLLCQHSRPGFHNPRGRQSTAALLPAAQPHARPGLRARAGDGPGCGVLGPRALPGQGEVAEEQTDPKKEEVCVPLLRRPRQAEIGTDRDSTVS